MGGPKVRLFVKSIKTLTGTEEFEHVTFPSRVGARPDKIEVEGKRTTGTFRVKAYQTETEPAYVIQEDLEKINTFPTITVGSGQKIEGVMTRKQIDNFLSRIQ
jgi:hypothetical protein